MLEKDKDILVNEITDYFSGHKLYVPIINKSDDGIVIKIRQLNNEEFIYLYKLLEEHNLSIEIYSSVYPFDFSVEICIILKI